MSSAPSRNHGNAYASQLPLRERLDKKNLPKGVFNLVPGTQIYPEWMEGTWRVKSVFSGYEFPSRIPKNQLARDPTVPGFQKFSVAAVPDIGYDYDYSLRFGPDASGKITADLKYNFESIIDSYTKQPAVSSISYDPSRNPNRLTIALEPGVSSNCQRIELFTNSRESELTAEGESPLFITSETLRQVNLGPGAEIGRSKELVLDYQLVYTYIPIGKDTIQATLSTVGYIQPNEAMLYSGDPMRGYGNSGEGPVRPDVTRMFTAVTDPVVLYSHTLTMTRVPSE